MSYLKRSFLQISRIWEALPSLSSLNAVFGKALCDLGANINLMPLSIFKKLGLGEEKPTLGDSSIGESFFQALKRNY